jgi:7-cyano-7-deazaguanine synthase in queuosine biosynthesis
MVLNLNFEMTKSGIVATLSGAEGVKKKKKFSLAYPGDFWSEFPVGIKGAFVDNLAHLLTINSPLISGQQAVKYNTSYPRFKPLFDELVKKSAPQGVEDYDLTAEELLNQFNGTTYEFTSEKPKAFDYEGEGDFSEKSINPLSFGKDSLTCLAVCKEIGLDPTAVYINETVSPIEHKIKFWLMKRLSEDTGVTVHIVRNEIEQLNDFEYWGKDESCIGYTHMVNAFAFISLPLAHKLGAKYVVIGNEKDMDFTFTSKGGSTSHASYEQTTEWTMKLSRMLNDMTAGHVSVMSVLEPLTNIATVRVLQTRYPEFGRWQTSCACLDGTNERRWCHDCADCAKNILYMKAFNLDFKRIGLRDILSDKKIKEHLVLFDGKEVDAWDKGKEARDQQLLTLFLAYRNGHRGPLFDMFKGKFLEEAEEREEELRKTFFTVYKSKSMPRKIEKSVRSIYKEELSDLV